MKTTIRGGWARIGAYCMVFCMCAGMAYGMLLKMRFAFPTDLVIFYSGFLLVLLWLSLIRALSRKRFLIAAVLGVVILVFMMLA